MWENRIFLENKYWNVFEKYLRKCFGTIFVWRILKMFSRNVFGRILKNYIWNNTESVFFSKLFLKYIQIECRKYIFEEKIVFGNALN